MVHLGSVCVTLFVFITVLWDITAILERNEALKGLVPGPRSNRRACRQSSEQKLLLSVPSQDPGHEKALSKWCVSCGEQPAPLCSGWMTCIRDTLLIKIDPHYYEGLGIQLQENTFSFCYSPYFIPFLWELDAWLSWLFTELQSLFYSHSVPSAKNSWVLVAD